MKNLLLEGQRKISRLEGMLRYYCNPLPLPNYPRGIHATAEHKAKGGNLWNRSRREDFREAADPSVLWHEGAWYLYVSGTMAYVSRDFQTWTHHPINIPWIGYAPTIVRHGHTFLLTACQAEIYTSDHPLGPFTALGPVCSAAGEKIDKWLDPMLFADEDGRLYAYWGLHDGIFGMELDTNHPVRGLSEPHYLFNFDPKHEWERAGEAHQFQDSYIEGAWMLKHQGRYYLTYAGPGTELTHYAMGCYVAESPLGPFVYQQRNPILRDPHGLVNGPGHGCLVRGPGGNALGILHLPDSDQPLV
ncbi:MAG: family 43 glycosylhydrolase [Blastochloris sp.]|nr:family 43 glycosylhydrolase [Blastochloris sp.]